MAQQGNAQAQYGLGVMYDEGKGVPQNDAQALAWYQKAAAQGNADAQYNLGVMYRKGEGVAQDFRKARQLFEQVIQGNDEEARQESLKELQELDAQSR